MKIHNFCAGPSILPAEVFEQASNAVTDLNGSGLSLLEISHRSHAFVEIMDEARDLSLELLGLSGKDYTSLFLQGGASSQFLMVAYNFLKNEAAYLNTGTWSKKAIKEAKIFGDVKVVGTSENENFNHIPEYDISEKYDYFHCTSNNTIFGTQINSFPSIDTPVFCDMSSDIFSRVLDFKKFDIIYAGAQKNLGPAGATLVVIKNDLLENINKNVPSMMNYKVHAEKSSMFNTPPVFAIYVSLLNMRWIKKIGGVSAIEEMNRKKFLLFPIIIEEKNDDLIAFSENNLFNNWNKYKKKSHLLEYLLPTEDLEDLNLIKKNYETIEKYNFEEITSKYNLDDSIVTLVFKNNNNVRILSRITIEEKVVLKNLSFSDINFDDEDDIKDLIDKLKIIYEDHWKIFNRINTSIKLPIFVKLDSDDNLKVSNFETILNEINLVYDYFVLKFDKNHIYYQIIFNGTPNIFLKLMKDKNFVFSTQNKTWILQ